MGPDEVYQRRRADYNRRVEEDPSLSASVHNQNSRHTNTAIAAYQGTDGNLGHYGDLYGQDGIEPAPYTDGSRGLTDEGYQQFGDHSQRLRRVEMDMRELFGREVSEQVMQRVLAGRAYQDREGGPPPRPPQMPPVLGVQPHDPESERAKRANVLQMLRRRGVHRDNSYRQNADIESDSHNVETDIPRMRGLYGHTTWDYQ